jgi:hypothetical protein
MEKVVLLGSKQLGTWSKIIITSRNSAHSLSLSPNERTVTHSL